MTEVEQILWEHLRMNRLSGFRFKAQHPIKNYIVDFYCHKAKLVVEVDGDIHNIESIKERDEGRSYVLKQLGLTVIRFTNEQVKNDIQKVVHEISKYLR